MYTIISATNRVGSNTLKVAKQYQLFFERCGIDTKLLSLENFNSFQRDESFKEIESTYLQPTSKFIFIMPEYNGSFPGIFKLMIDLSDISTCWNFKKVMLVGVAAGRAGNLRGIDIMTNMCHYMKMDVFHNKLPLSSINNELKDDELSSDVTIQTILTQIKSFIEY